ncbi:MAG: phytoene desaturase family protein, partial [Candidatus Acidiferrales bacterium]
MAGARDIVIVGAGHNGLVTAFYLARAGLKPLVLERRAVVGGAAVTEEFHPGFRCSSLAHTASSLAPEIINEMQLGRHGLEMIHADPCLFAPAPDGRALTFYQDAARTARDIAPLSPKDAQKYPQFQQMLGRAAKVLGHLLRMPPPDIDTPSGGDLWSLLKTYREFRRLGRKDMFRLLRWPPMAVADFVSEWFDTELLRAAVAARGVFGNFMGPWSAGSTT